MRWIATDKIQNEDVQTADGFLIAPGTPYANMENVHRAIRFGRENNIPTLGTCGGFQHMIIEYARNVLDREDAQHAEYTQEYTESTELFIAPLSCSLRGKVMDIQIAAEIYCATEVQEKYYRTFGVNPDYSHLLQNGPVTFTGVDSDGEDRIMEYPDHLFFVGTLFVPQTSSTVDKPHPVINAFIQAVLS